MYNHAQSNLILFVINASVCVCVCVRAFARARVLWLNGLESAFGECKHPAPCRVASSSHSDGELWLNFPGEETYTQLPLLTQEYK